MEADSEPKTRIGGMNINNFLCWKIVTMDIIERQKEGSSIPSLTFCMRACMTTLACKKEHI